MNHMRSLAGLGLVWLATGMAAAQTRLMFSYEQPSDLQNIKTEKARVSRVRQNATDGSYALQVDFESAESPRIEFAPSQADFRPFGSLALDASNPAEEPLAFFVELQDSAGARTVARTALPLRPRESATIAFPLNSPAPLEMGMRGEPAISGYRLMAGDHKPVDASSIAAIRVYLAKTEKPRALVIDNVRLAPGVSYDKIVDMFGQSAKEQWPGKLKHAGEFQSRTAEEEAELKLRPSLADRDEYGAWASGPKLKATGFFHPARQGGRWWLVAPNGRLFFSIGMDCVTTREGGTVIDGRGNMFEWLPAAGDPLAAHFEEPRRWAPIGLKNIRFNIGKTFNFYAANLQRKYGPEWPEKWRETALARLRAWGVNTIANWSDPVFYENKRVPYTVTLAIRGETGEVSSGSDYWGRMRDVFDPRFATAVDESVRATAEARRNDPWCLGYFVDNEIAWGNMRSDRGRYGLALGALSMPADSAAKRALVEQVRARHGGIDRLNQAWGTRFASWEELLHNPYRPEGELNSGLKTDLAVYMKEFATRYFRTIRDALRKYDPNHLYLGTRFAGYTREEVEACAEYCDVISFNIYRARVNPSEWSALDGIDKPVIIGEFHMGALDRGMFHTGLVSTPDQAARAAMYQDYLRSVADHPLFVGCHWFKYNDEPLTGRPGDGENYNIGFTTVTDGVYPELVAAAKAVHGEVYQRHTAGGGPAAVAAPQQPARVLVLENKGLRLELQQADGSIRLLDKASGEAWAVPSPQVTLKDKRVLTVQPSGPAAKRGDTLVYPAEPGMEFRLRLIAGPPAVEYSVEPGAQSDEVMLLRSAFELGPGEKNYYAVPQRLGVLFPVEGDKPFNRRLRAYDTGRGYSMAWFGAVKNGSAMLVSWQDPYTDAMVDYAVEPTRKLTMGIALRRTSRSLRLQPIGRGGYVEIAKAYRAIARERGYLVTLAEKMKTRPQVEQFFGAADFKPFAFVRNVPNTRWNQTPREQLRISFSFEECADLAEHYKKDLGIDRAMLVLNGWINGGYDNRHPDVLPAAPEIGGNEALKAASRRVKTLGWLFGLHDNYQDMYKEAASWNEDYIMKNQDGSLHAGGVWAGGPCWLICSRKSTELARRPQNIPQVKELFAPTLYFSDTIFAAPPYECFDPKHPLTLADDIRYKQELCDYLRGEFGLFGSEEGREWGVPHADYFEGLMSHRTRFQRPNDTDIVIPLFELVYGDAIPLYTHQSDRPKPNQPEFILNHIAYAEMPVYFFGNHRYWTDPSGDFRPPAGSEPRMVFAKGGHFNLIDQFIKNTYEVLSPLHRVTALMAMTDHRFLSDRQVEHTRFGADVEITVNYGPADYKTANAVLPQYGFAVESPTLVAHYAKAHQGKSYTEPTLVVIRSMDGKPLAKSTRVSIYHPFGDPNITFRGKTCSTGAQASVISF